VLSRIMANHIESATERSRKPEKFYALWMEYILSRGLDDEHWDMRGYTPELWTRRYLLFLTWLVQRKENPKQGHNSMITFFKGHSRDPPALHSPLVSDFFKGLGKLNTPRARRVKAMKSFINRKLPAPTELFPKARELLWRPEARQATGMGPVVHSLAYLVIMLQFASGYRVSNFVHTTPDAKAAKHKTRATDDDDKHAARQQDVFFVLNSDLSCGIHPADVDPDRSKVRMGHEFVWSPRRSSRVLGICWLFWTTKSRAYVVEPFWLKRGRSEMEDQLIEDVAFSRRWAPAHPDALFFSATSLRQESCPFGKRVQYGDVQKGIKKTAESLGLPRSCFSTNSARKTGMSNLMAVGASEAETLAYSRHASIRTVRLHYAFPTTKVVRGQSVFTSLLGITSDHGFATKDLQDIVMAMWVARMVKA
jgi:hypothetical protein